MSMGMGMGTQCRALLYIHNYYTPPIPIMCELQNPLTNGILFPNCYKVPSTHNPKLKEIKK